MNNMPRNFPHTIKLSDDQQETLDRLDRLKKDMRGQIHTTTTDTASVMAGHTAATCLHYADAQDDAQGLIPDNVVVLPQTTTQTYTDGNGKTVLKSEELKRLIETGMLRSSPKRHVDSEQDDEEGRVGNLLGNVGVYVLMCLVSVLVAWAVVSPK